MRGRRGTDTFVDDRALPVDSLAAGNEKSTDLGRFQASIVRRILDLA
jgi:hypothetical protein